ncbi:MAG: NAD(P)-binding protein [Cyanobacteriota bacterium]|nr:NAD(P)-binding protein [Cyanobacteriota bacterium]
MLYPRGRIAVLIKAAQKAGATSKTEKRMYLRPPDPRTDRFKQSNFKLVCVPQSVGIIGAGPAGLTAGYLLSKSGFQVDIFEADLNYVGGISRTEEYKGFRLDIGGHRFFSKSREIEALWSEILPDDMITRDRLSRIYYKKKFYSYPLEASEVVANLGKGESLLCIASYLRAKLTPRARASNLEEWVTAKFGSRLYRTFFKSYSEKVWGKACSEISADWAAQRIKGLSLTTAALASIRPRPPVQPEGDRANQIKTLITAFRYPRLGPGMMWEAAAERISTQGGRVMMNSRVQRLELDQAGGGWYLEQANSSANRHGPYHHVISSAPLGSIIPAIANHLPAELHAAASGLSYRDFLLVALILRPGPSFPDQWLYIHEPDLQVGRIQNFASWSPEMVDGSGRRCYGMEYFCFSEDVIWNLSNQELIALAAKELEALGLAEPGEVVDGCVVRQAKAYPVYDDTYQHRIDTIKAGLARHCPGLHQVGRNGMHRYNNQDHSMMTAMLTVRNILEPESELDPWLVNQDAEYIETTTNSAPAQSSKTQPNPRS